jgi:hypothetical protein
LSLQEFWISSYNDNLPRDPLVIGSKHAAGRQPITPANGRQYAQGGAYATQPVYDMAQQQQEQFRANQQQWDAPKEA